MDCLFWKNRIADPVPSITDTQFEIKYIYIFLVDFHFEVMTLILESLID